MISPAIENVTRRCPAMPLTNEQRWEAVRPLYVALRNSENFAREYERGAMNDAESVDESYEH